MRFPRLFVPIAFLGLAGLLHSQVGTGTGTGPPPGGAGGTYRGPGDTIPPGGNGGGGGGNGFGGPPRPGPGAPPPTGGYAPGANPLTPPPFLPGSSADPTANEPMSPGTLPRTDNPTSWQSWWHYNRWSHLRPSEAAALATSGSSGFYLGQGERTQIEPRLRPGASELRDVVRPALVASLRKGPSVELAIGAEIALAKLRGVSALEPSDELLKVLKPLCADPSQAISEKALLALGLSGDPAALAELDAVLHEEARGRRLLGRSSASTRHRVFAAAALGLLGEHSLDPAFRGHVHAVLARVVRDRDAAPEIQAAALLALGHVPLPIDSPPIAPEGGSFRSDTRIEQVLTVLAFFEHPSSELLPRTQAPRTLARLVEDTPESLRQRVLLSLLAPLAAHTKADDAVVGACVQALGQIARGGSDPLDTAVRRELERLAFRSSEDRLVRSLATVALARCASRPGPGDKSLAALEDTRRTFVQRLPRSRGNQLAWLTLSLGLLEESAGERGEAVAPEVSELLRELLRENRGEEVGGAAAIALGLARDVEAEPLLIETMEESGNERVRGYAALALGLIGQPTSTTALRAFVQRSAQQPFALEQGAFALAMLGDQEVGPSMLRILDEGVSTGVQASIASIMGWIRDPRALSRLAERLADGSLSDTARAWSAVAIGRIADEDETPWIARLSSDVHYDVVFPELIDPEFHEGLLDLP